MRKHNSQLACILWLVNDPLTDPQHGPKLLLNTQDNLKQTDVGPV